MRLARQRRPLVFAAAVSLATLVALPLGGSYLTSLSIIIALHTIVTVGLCLLMGYAGQASLGQAAFYGLGAFTSGILTTRFEMSPWLALLVAALGCGLIAFAIGRPIFSLRGPYLALATLAFGIVVWVLFSELKDLTGGPQGLSGIPPLAIGDFAFDSDTRIHYLAWTICLLALAFAHNIVRGRPGRALRAIRESEDSASAVGIDVAAYKVRVFVLSAVYASVAGSVYAHYVSFVSPQPFDFLFSVRLLTMVAVGGLASVWGAAFGAAAVTLLSAVLQSVGELDVIVFGLILVVLMIHLPQGLIRGLLDTHERRQIAARRSRPVAGAIEVPADA